ncbi:male-enhanced antigen 1 [Manduca sexta]|uniref:Male-enhanced antigen 1 n=1 Tax=Manduca sexta TaxID=7130 RepID=A0A922CP59_MANSE|nr:male-enhanced antigen 1 [Manduca sexta]XP_037298234.1 male-enhanced antigen 1 [Manduca sexta]KAG6453095.1 hypothetical protein O3G_MSEX007974 [Manduca sexta]KAG6453096.1 hypothetical protein O3G_MSEX007974 [Manduca sexta]
MVCDGPDPPENNPHELNPPPRHELIMNGQQADESDEENEYFGYEPLAQGPEITHSDRESDEDVPNNVPPTNNVPPIESMDNILTRDVWNTPRNSDPIQMDGERAQQVMSAMANFSLPPTSIPEWAQSISEEQWKKTLSDTIEKIKNNR